MVFQELFQVVRIFLGYLPHRGRNFCWQWLEMGKRCTGLADAVPLLETGWNELFHKFGFPRGLDHGIGAIGMEVASLTTDTAVRNFEERTVQR